MTQSHMKFIYITQDGNACHTNVIIAKPTSKETRALFNSYRQFNSLNRDTRFILDYYNKKGDLVDTLHITADNFEAITGTRPLTSRQYQKIDRDYWRNVKLAAKRGTPK